MADVNLYHNPRCSKSRAAHELLDGRDDVEVIRYLDTPPTREQLVEIVGKLRDDPADLVRKDKRAELGVSADDVATTDGIIDTLVRHPQLLERPLIVTADEAFIGRPTERVSDFLATR